MQLRINLKREERQIFFLQKSPISAKGGTYPTGMRNRSNFAKGNRFSARQGSQPLGSREFRARAAALNGYLAEIAAYIYKARRGLPRRVILFFFFFLLGYQGLYCSSLLFLLVFLFLVLLFRFPSCCMCFASFLVLLRFVFVTFGVLLLVLLASL